MSGMAEQFVRCNVCGDWTDASPRTEDVCGKCAARAKPSVPRPPPAMRRGEPPSIGGSPGRMDAAKEAGSVIEPLNAMRYEEGRLVPNTRCPSCQQDALRFDRTEAPLNICLCGSCGLEHRSRYAIGNKRQLRRLGGGLAGGS